MVEDSTEYCNVVKVLKSLMKGTKVAVFPRSEEDALETLRIVMSSVSEPLLLFPSRRTAERVLESLGRPEHITALTHRQGLKVLSSDANLNPVVIYGAEFFPSRKVIARLKCPVLGIFFAESSILDAFDEIIDKRNFLETKSEYIPVIIKRGKPAIGSISRELLEVVRDILKSEGKAIVLTRTSREAILLSYLLKSLPIISRVPPEFREAAVDALLRSDVNCIVAPRGSAVLWVPGVKAVITLPRSLERRTLNRLLGLGVKVYEILFLE